MYEEGRNAAIIRHFRYFAAWFSRGFWQRHYREVLVPDDEVVRYWEGGDI
jgi:hypothetical protein